MKVALFAAALLFALSILGRAQAPNVSADTIGRSDELSAIWSETFQGKGLPHGWYADLPMGKFSPGAWDCRKADGAIIPLPHDAWEVLRLEADIADIGPEATALCRADGRTSLILDLGNAPGSRHSASDGGFIIEQSSGRVPIAKGTAKIIFEWTSDTMTASANGEVLITARNLRKSARAGNLHASFRGCIVTRIAAFGKPRAEIPEAPRAIEKGYPLEVTVDFNDDLMACAWTHETFDALFAKLKTWGTRKVSWIDLGREADGFFDSAPYGTGEHGRKTFRNVGDIFTAAVQHAHKHGIELIGILKPYDMAIHGFSFPPKSDPGTTAGRIKRIGGAAYWTTHLAAENQHLIMARKPSAYGPAKNKTWTRLDLVKDDALEAGISPADITLLVSDDNETFRVYEGPVQRSESVEEYPIYASTPSGPRPTAQTRRARVFRFEKLEIREPYFAIEVHGSARSFSNRLCDLVHLHGEHGEETHFTYGLLPRRTELKTLFPLSNAPAPSAGPPRGFEYNRYPGTPSAYMRSGGDPINTPLALDRGADSYIAFARGKDRGPLGAMSPSFPETRALWMKWVEAMLDAGADGIDLRPGHHHSDFSWIEYGFEEPVRNEMLKRTGVDIWKTDDFDHEQWRRIRGEGWTQFIREASKVVRARGRKFTVHIDDYFDGAPGTGGAMNMVCDWRSWLTDGLCDGVTAKGLWPGSSFARELLALAHRKGVPVTFAPYCNNFFEDRSKGDHPNHVGDSPIGCEVPVERLIEWGKRSGFDRFFFHECASALRATPEGTVDFRPNAAPLGGVMQRHFSSEASGAAPR